VKKYEEEIFGENICEITVKIKNEQFLRETILV
jgi:hypothetical protein